jgi:two-component system sensor histidine kinase UhpB
MRAVRDAAGSVVSFESFVRDITPRREAEVRLRESEERFRLVERATNDLIWDWDFASGRVRGSESGVRILGYPPSAPDHRVEMERPLLHPADRERVVGALDAALAGGADAWSDEYRVQRADGTYATIFNRGTILRDGSGRASRMVGSAVDVTARRRAEENLRQVTAQIETVREAERKYLSRELHDSLGQLLTALKLDLAALAQRLPASSRGARARLQAATALVDTAMEVTQRVAAELRPGILDDLGLVAAVRWAAAEFERRSEIPCVVEVALSDAPVDDALATTIFRVLQESLTNVARHAHATRVSVHLASDQREVSLTVRDNGRGIDAAEAAREQRLGLLGMRERVSAWGGVVEIAGRRDEGTTVWVRIPLEGPAVEERAS